MGLEWTVKWHLPEAKRTRHTLRALVPAKPQNEATEPGVMARLAEPFVCLARRLFRRAR